MRRARMRLSPRWTISPGAIFARTHHGEGGQDVFAFPPVEARFVRWTCDDPQPERGPEIVEFNLYGPTEAASVLERGRVAALGHAPVRLPLGESITVDFGWVRSPLGAFIEWGEDYGTVFSVHLSDDGESFREVGRIETGDGGSDSFWWRSTTARYFRLTVHEASAPEGAVVNELKLRVLNKDRMPIGQLERAALAGRGDLYPQSLLGRQVYWTVLGDFDQEEEALFDEHGNLEPQRGAGQTMPFLRLNGVLHGAAASPGLSQSLAEGSLPVPTVVWSAEDIELRITALAHAGQAMAEYRVVNRSRTTKKGALVLAARPVQVNPYWQHGGHAAINAIAVDGALLSVNDKPYAAFSTKPGSVAIADFDGGDVIRFVEAAAHATASSLRSGSGLLSAAAEFPFALRPGRSVALLASFPMRDGVAPRAETDFHAVRNAVVQRWRDKIGRRRITVGDREVSDTVEAQTALILVNATRFAFKPGPRNYDRTWIRDGSSQALALLWAGLMEEAKDYVLWYSKRIYAHGLVPPILNVDGTVNRGYGSDIEFDAQGEFVGIAADVYRITRDRAFLSEVFEPVVRATKFIEELCARTNAMHGPESPLHGLVAPSISHEGYSKPSYSYWDDYFALSAWRNCEYLALEIDDANVAARAKASGRRVRRRSDALDPHDGRKHGKGAHSRLGRPRGRRSDRDRHRLRTLSGRGRPPGRTDFSDLRPLRQPHRKSLRPRLQRKLHTLRAAQPQRFRFPWPVRRRVPAARGGAGLPEASRLAALGGSRLERRARPRLHRRHATHLDRSGVRHRDPPHVAQGKRRDAGAVPGRARPLVGRRRHRPARFADGVWRSQPQGQARGVPGYRQSVGGRAGAEADHDPSARRQARSRGRRAMRDRRRHRRGAELPTAGDRHLSFAIAPRRVASPGVDDEQSSPVAGRSHPSLLLQFALGLDLGLRVGSVFQLPAGAQPVSVRAPLRLALLEPDLVGALPDAVFELRRVGLGCTGFVAVRILFHDRLPRRPPTSPPP